MYSRSPLKSF